MKTRYIAAFFILAILGGLLFGIRKNPPIEVPRAQLALVDGKLHLLSSSKPFTGWTTENYTNGLLRSRTFVQKGLLNGASEGWDTEGKLQVREHFRDSISHGLRTKWHPNGRKMSEGIVRNGKFEGAFRRWNVDGTLAEEIEMRNGVPDGLSLAYYSNGTVKTELQIQNGNVIGRKSWTEQGSSNNEP